MAWLDGTFHYRKYEPEEEIPTESTANENLLKYPMNTISICF